MAFGDQNEADAIDFVMEPELNIFASTGSRLGFGGFNHTQPSPTPTPRELHFGEQFGRIQTTKGIRESGSPTMRWCVLATRGRLASPHTADVRSQHED